MSTGRSKDSLYDPVLADSEREAVADLLGFLENVWPQLHLLHEQTKLIYLSRGLRPTFSLENLFEH